MAADIARTAGDKNGHGGNLPFLSFSLAKAFCKASKPFGLFLS
jgi:hypothetical protein